MLPLSAICKSGDTGILTARFDGVGIFNFDQLIDTPIPTNRKCPHNDGCGDVSFPMDCNNFHLLTTDDPSTTFRL